jgi:hypothetical protein
MPISSNSATDMLSTPVLSPQERHCSSLVGGRRVVGMENLPGLLSCTKTERELP